MQILPAVRRTSGAILCPLHLSHAKNQRLTAYLGGGFRNPSGVGPITRGSCVRSVKMEGQRFIFLGRRFSAACYLLQFVLIVALSSSCPLLSANSFVLPNLQRLFVQMSELGSSANVYVGDYKKSKQDYPMDWRSFRRKNGKRSRNQFRDSRYGRHDFAVQFLVAGHRAASSSLSESPGRPSG